VSLSLSKQPSFKDQPGAVRHGGEIERRIFPSAHRWDLRRSIGGHDQRPPRPVITRSLWKAGEVKSIVR